MGQRPVRVGRLSWFRLLCGYTEARPKRRTLWLRDQRRETPPPSGMDHHIAIDNRDGNPLLCAMPDEKRTIRMSIALTPTEAARLGTAAMVANRKVSDYTRDAALQRAVELLGPLKQGGREGEAA